MFKATRRKKTNSFFLQALLGNIGGRIHFMIFCEFVILYNSSICDLITNIFQQHVYFFVSCWPVARKVVLKAAFVEHGLGSHMSFTGRLVHILSVSFGSASQSMAPALRSDSRSRGLVDHSQQECRV